MSTEQVLGITTIAGLLVLGGRAVAKYVWTKFTQRYEQLEAEVSSLKAEMKALKGAPAIGDEPAIEGVIPKQAKQISELDRANAVLTEKVGALQEDQQRTAQERDGAWLALDRESGIRRQAESDRDAALEAKRLLTASLDEMKQQLQANTDDIQQMKETHRQELAKAQQETAAERQKRLTAETERDGLLQKITGLEKDIRELKERFGVLENSKGDTGPLNPNSVPNVADADTTASNEMPDAGKQLSP